MLVATDGPIRKRRFQSGDFPNHQIYDEKFSKAKKSSLRVCRFNLAADGTISLSSHEPYTFQGRIQGGGPGARAPPPDHQK